MAVVSEGLQPGAVLEAGGIRFSVWSGAAERIWVSIFDDHDRETDRVELAHGEQYETGTRIAERMADRDRPAVWIDARVVERQS